MAFTLVFCLGAVVLAVAPQAGGTTKEDSGDLDMMKMAEVKETLVVVKRNHTTATNVRCQSVKKAEQYNKTQYEYTLRARLKGGISPKYGEYNVNVTLVRFGDDEKYKSTYTDINGTHYNLTLKNMDNTGTCFVIFVEKSDGNKGCELLVRASKRNEIPSICKRYYNTTCTGFSRKLYKNDCNFNEDHQTSC
uniref:Putative secreted protein n=1 Tax=Amblyomma cajennense TaxID=34607 RepID=A0A023FTS3_AMBCJ